MILEFLTSQSKQKMIKTGIKNNNAVTRIIKCSINNKCQLKDNKLGVYKKRHHGSANRTLVYCRMSQHSKTFIHSGVSPIF